MNKMVLGKVVKSEEVGHDFHGMCIPLSHKIMQ